MNGKAHRKCSGEPKIFRNGFADVADTGRNDHENTAIAVIGIDIGKNSFHVVGHDARGAIVPRQKWSRGQWKRGSPIYRLA